MILLQQINWSDIFYSYDEFGRQVYSFPVHIRVLLAITLIFILVIFILLGVVLSSRIFKTGRTIKRNNLKTKFQKAFGLLLFEERLHGKEIRKYFDRADLIKGFNRSVLTEEIIHLHDNFSGETAERLEDIFIELGLHNDAIESLKDKRWYIASKGMRSLALMNVKDSLPHILPFTTNPNEVLRMESRIAIMKLSEEDPLSFLSGKNIQMSGWDAAKIYVMLSKLPERLIPDFGRWLESTNDDVVLFCVQMIGSIRQQTSIPKLLALLNSDNEKIRIAVIKAIRALNASQAEKNLIEMYGEASTDIKLEILKSLEVVGSSNSANFLKNILRPPLKDFQLLIQAVRGLLTLGARGKEIIENMYLNSGEEMQLIIRHAKDKRL